MVVNNNNAVNKERKLMSKRSPKNNNAVNKERKLMSKRSPKNNNAVNKEIERRVNAATNLMLKFNARNKSNPIYSPNFMSPKHRKNIYLKYNNAKKFTQFSNHKFNRNNAIQVRYGLKDIIGKISQDGTKFIPNNYTIKKYTNAHVCHALARKENMLSVDKINEKRANVLKIVKAYMEKHNIKHLVSEPTLRNKLPGIKHIKYCKKADIDVLTVAARAIDKEFLKGLVFKENPKLRNVVVCSSCACGSKVMANTGHESKSLLNINDYNVIPIKIRMSRYGTRHFPASILIRTSNDNFITTLCGTPLTCHLSTLEHELVHALIYRYCESSANSNTNNYTSNKHKPGGHGPTFMSIISNRFGQLSHTLSSINMKQQRKNISNLYKGWIKSGQYTPELVKKYTTTLKKLNKMSNHNITKLHRKEIVNIMNLYMPMVHL